jgi:hypothetical protein
MRSTLRSFALAALTFGVLAPAALAGPQIPSKVVESEMAMFRGSDGQPATVTIRGMGKNLEATGEALLGPGIYQVKLKGERNILRMLSPRMLVVRPLPKPVAASAPLEDRIVYVQIHRWDNGETGTGRFLNGLGRNFGSVLIPSAYNFSWVLAGTQTTQRNVKNAIDTLARRGYVVDVFSAVHGYPIQLADGEWVPDHAGLRSVRLFYTTACYGARGQQDFRNAGVRTYVAAEGVNIVSAFHMTVFSRNWAAGRTVADSSARAFRFTKGAGDSFLLRWAARKAAGVERGGDLTQVWKDTEPKVFGDGSIRILTDTQLEGLARTEAEGSAMRSYGMNRTLKRIILGPVGSLLVP